MLQKKVYLHKIAPVVPDHYYTQDFAIDFLSQLYSDDKKMVNFIKRVYSGSAIHKRHTVITDYGKPPEEYTFYPKK